MHVIIVLTSINVTEISDMLNQFHNESKKLGMKINMKTKVMFNNIATRETIYLSLKDVESVDEYVYFGQLITLANDNIDKVKR